MQCLLRSQLYTFLTLLRADRIPVKKKIILCFSLLTHSFVLLPVLSVTCSVSGIVVRTIRQKKTADCLRALYQVE